MRTVRTSQPQGPVGIDWGNPIARGLVFAWTPYGFSSPYASSPVGVFSGTGTTRKVGRFGKAIQGGSGGDGLSFSIGLAAAPSVATGVSFLLIGGYESSQFAVAATSPVGWLRNYGNGILSIVNDTGGTSRYVQIAPTSQNWTGDGVLVCTTNAAKNLGKSLINGVAYSNTANAAGSPATASTVNVLQSIVGDRASITRWNQNCYLIVQWQRELSDVELKSLSDNPWQIFQPTNRAIWTGFDAGTSGSPYTLTAEAGAVAIAGTATGLAFNRTLVADAASLAVNGTATSFAFTRRLTADTGALAVNGTATGLAFNRKLIADTANLALTGNAATLTFTPIGGPTYTLTADTANTPIAGTATGLAFNRRLIADTANAPINGTATGLARGYTLAANNGTLGISGSDAALIAVRKLIADSYALAVAGADATLTYTPLTLPTIGRPTSDTSNTGWTASTGVDLYAMLDEVTPSATDYISASSVGAVCKMALNSTAYPGTASQVLKYRASSSTGNSVIVRLKEGVTTIRAETQALTSVDTEYSITLTSGEIAAITSGSLSVELESA